MRRRAVAGHRPNVRAFRVQPAEKSLYTTPRMLLSRLPSRSQTAAASPQGQMMRADRVFSPLVIPGWGGSRKYRTESARMRFSGARNTARLRGDLTLGIEPTITRAPSSKTGSKTGRSYLLDIERRRALPFGSSTARPVPAVSHRLAERHRVPGFIQFAQRGERNLAAALLRAFRCLD